MLEFFRSRRWVVTRRLFLVAVLLIVGLRQYGGMIASRFRAADAPRDIIITRSEFRPAGPDERPGWIITFHNQSSRYTYDKIRVEATYMDAAGKVLQTDKLVISQKLPPGSDQVVGSLDPKNRGTATHGTLKIVDAEVQ